MANAPVRVRKHAGGDTNYVGTMIVEDDGAVMVLGCDPTAVGSLTVAVPGEHYGSLAEAINAGWVVVPAWVAP